LLVSARLARAEVALFVITGERVLARVEAERVVFEDGARVRCPDGKPLVVGAKRIEWRGAAAIDCAAGDVTIGAREHEFSPGAQVRIDSPHGWVRFIAWHTVGEPRLAVTAAQADLDPERAGADLGPLVATRVRRSLLRRLVLEAPVAPAGQPPKVHFPREKWHSEAKARRRQGWLARLALDAAGRNLTVTSGSDRAGGAHAQGRAIDVVGPAGFGERLRMAALLSRALGKKGLVLVEEVDAVARAGAPDGYQCNVGFKQGFITSVRVGVRYPPDLGRQRQASPYHATRSHLHVVMYRGRRVPDGAAVVELDGDDLGRAARAVIADAD